MKNWTLKNLNLKKALMVCLCLVFGLTCASLFAFMQNSKSQTVEALTIENQIASPNFGGESQISNGLVIPFGEKADSNISMMSVTNSTSSTSGDYWFVFQNSSGTELTGDSLTNIKSKIFKAGNYIYLDSSNKNIIKFYEEDTTSSTFIVQVEVKYQGWATFKNYKFGYKLDGEVVYLDTYNWSGSSSTWLSLSSLDPAYTGEIVIAVECNYVGFSLEMYNSFDMGAFQGKTTSDTYNKAKAAKLEDTLPTDIEEGKEFNGWYFYYDSVDVYYDISVDTTNKKLTVTRAGGYDYFEQVPTLMEAAELIFTYTEIYTDAAGTQYYKITEVSGYGTLKKSSAEASACSDLGPFIFAKYSGSYKIKIENDDSYWKDLMGHALWDVKDICGAYLTSGSYVSYSYKATVSSVTSETTTLLAKNIGSAFKTAEKIKEISDTYYVLNYGYNLVGWKIFADGTSDSYSYDVENDIWEKVETVNDAKSNMFSDFDYDLTLGQIVASLDATGITIPTDPGAGIYGDGLILYPVWEKAIVRPVYSVSGASLSSDIKYTEEYALSGGSAQSGQTMVAYQTETSDLISPKGVWNYINIPSEEYEETSAGSGIYKIKLNVLGLDNIYKVKLNNIKKNVDGNYELENDDYSYFTSSDEHKNLSEDVITHTSDVVGLSLTEWENYYYKDNITHYLRVLQTYCNDYNELIDGDGTKDLDIFNKINYSTGTVDGSVLTATNPELWIYLANGQKSGDFPMFKSKYSTTIAWAGDSHAFTTSEYKDEYEPEIDGYFENLGVSSYTSSADNVWTYSAGVSLTAVYMSRLNLYYPYDSGYAYVDASPYGVVTELDFSEVGSDIDLGETIGGGWIFDVTTATEDYGYVVPETIQAGQTISVTNDELITYFYVSEVNPINNNFLVVTKVRGDEFLQEDDNPIITMKAAYKYNVTIDNSSTYWSEYVSTKSNDELYGATSSEGGGEFTTTFTVADGDLFAYPIMTSEKVVSGKTVGMSFFQNSDFTSEFRANIENVDTEKYYYVYNYGHYIIGYKITFGFATNSSLNGEVQYVTGNFIAKQESTSNYYRIDNTTEFLTLRNIVRAIDDYMLGNLATEIPEVTITPIWAAVPITVSVIKDNSKYTTNTQIITTTEFGQEYTFANEAVTAPKGQSLFAYAYKEQSVLLATNETTTGADGRWNYQGIAFDQNLITYSSGSSVGDGIYTIKVNPVFVDNIYKINLDNVVEVETGKYQLETTEFCKIDSASSVLTFDDAEDIDKNGYVFSYYQTSEALIDDYITELNEYYVNYLEGINGNGTSDFTIFNKVYLLESSNGSLIKSKYDNDTVLISSPNFFIYLANNQPILEMPEFVNDLSMLIHWENTNGYYTYLTSKFDENLYSCELKHETNSSVIYSAEETWQLAHGGSADDLSLKARYVYSVRLYYKTDDAISAGIFESVNTNELSYFGRYTADFMLIDEVSGNILEELRPETNPTDQIFSCWMLDTNRVPSQYTIDDDTSNKIITIKDDLNEWKFGYSVKNAYSTNLYYITKIVSGYTRLMQSNVEPIIYAKYANLFDLTIDNTSTYWANVGVVDDNLYGANSHETSSNFATTTFKVGSVATGNSYDYAFMTSEGSDSVGLSFYHASDWKTEEARNNHYATTPNGYYYVFNYGHYIKGWQIRIEAGDTYQILYEQRTGDTGYNWYELKNPIEPTTIEIDLLKNKDVTSLADLAEFADEVVAGIPQKAKLVMVPVWGKANIIAKIPTKHAYIKNDLIISGKDEENVEIPFAEEYVFKSKVSVPLGQSVMCYKYINASGAESLIATSGFWNYKNIPAGMFETYAVSEDEKVGAGSYIIELTPHFVDNIYKVNLTNATRFTTDENGNLIYKLENTDFRFYSKPETYYNAPTTELTFANKIDKEYQFVSYSNAADPMIDDYIVKLKELKESYESGISERSFEIFETVYYSAGTASATGNVEGNDILTVSAAPQFHIYLANGQDYGKLPVFKKDYYILIFWKNSNFGSTKNYYAYATAEYRSDMHKEEINKYETHVNDNGDFTNVWKLSDGYAVDENNQFDVTFEAVYYRKNYELQVDTLNEDKENQLERRGYVRVEIFDFLHEYDDTLPDTGGNYIIMLNDAGEAMEIYKYDQAYTGNESLVDDAEFRDRKVESIRLFAGCNVTMYVFDQSQDPRLMKTGDYDDMIGYRFSQKLTHQVGGEDVDNDKALFGKLKAGTTDEYVVESVEGKPYQYFVDAETIDKKDYKNNETLKVNVLFKRIIYELTFEIDNYLAGEFSVKSNGTSSGYKTSLTLDNLSVQNSYAIDYYAYAGFKLEDAAFVLNNRKATLTLQSYNETAGEISQEYIVTKNFYEDNTLDGTWLREYFYVNHDDYNVENINLGKLIVMTCPIVFNFGVKVYDETDVNFIDSNNIIETQTSYVSLSLNETTGRALTPEIYTYLSNQDYGFYYYVSSSNVEYALLSSRMYFTNNYLTTIDNFYTTYSFLLTQKPTNQSSLSSIHLSQMVMNYEEGKIIKVDDRDIYIMFEARKLLKVDMLVQSLEHDSNASIRKTTLTNADKNVVQIVVEPGASTENLIVSPMAERTYFVSSTGECAVRAFTYFGLENNLESVYDTARYSGIEYELNNSGSALTGNNFVVEEDSVLAIKYLTSSLKTEIVYMLEDDVVQESVMQAYINDTNIYKPDSNNVYHVGDYVTYLVESIHPNYYVSVAINGQSMGSTDQENRKVELINENRYQVSNRDYSIGKIQIIVQARLQNNGEIRINYQLRYKEQMSENDNFGTFSVLENETIKLENVSTAQTKIFENSDVHVSLNLPVGYAFYGIKKGNGTPNTERADANGLIKVVGNFDPDVNSGDYYIVIEKISLNAVLDTSNVHKNSTYSMKDNTNNSEWRKDLSGLYVGCVVAFKSAPSQEERLDYFYYLDKSKNKVAIPADANSNYVMVTITSEMIESIGKTMIDFGIAVIERYKLDITLEGEEFVKDQGFKLETSTGEEYVSGTYVDKNTEIEILLETKTTGKYDISISETPEVISKEKFDIITKGDVKFTLIQNYSCVITVSPKVFNVNAQSNVYTTLSAVQENVPDTEIGTSSKTGYSYGSQAIVNIARQTQVVLNGSNEDSELFALYISGNDIADELLIEIIDGEVKTYKIVEGNKESINLSSYGIEIKIISSNIELTYTISNDLNVRCDYKAYKVISS